MQCLLRVRMENCSATDGTTNVLVWGGNMPLRFVRLLGRDARLGTEMAQFGVLWEPSAFIGSPVTVLTCRFLRPVHFFQVPLPFGWVLVLARVGATRRCPTRARTGPTRPADQRWACSDYDLKRERGKERRGAREDGK